MDIRKSIELVDNRKSIELVDIMARSTKSVLHGEMFR